MSVPKEFEITPDEVAALESLSKKIYGFNCYMGWHDKPREAGTDCALIHSEISEAMEGFRKGLNDDHLPHRAMAEVEFADAIIRILDTCGKYSFNVGEALSEKFVYNGQRADHKREARNAEGGKKF